LALLSPAGLWSGDNPLYNRISLRVTRFLACHATGPLSRLVAYRWARILILGQTHGRPTRIDPDHARIQIRAFGSCEGFDATMKATRHRHYRAESPVDAPVTVAFGSRDFLLLPRQSRHLERLPPGTHIASLPGCGHNRWPTIPRRSRHSSSKLQPLCTKGLRAEGLAGSAEGG